jgi:3-methyladenine DNA glycosylase/8-oxoguanine DNA glycosylase
MASGGFTAASHQLAALDPVFAGLVEAHGPPRLARRPRADERFQHLARAICHQQLAGNAAQAIWGRVRALAPDFTAEAFLALPEAELRGAGLSASKTAAMVDLAQHVADGQVDLAAAGRLDDETVIAQLVQVRGIGRWTAQMFLLSGLRRLDVWPVDDYGVRLGWQWAHDDAEMLTPRQLHEAGERLRPVRSAAAWYCWEAVHARRASDGA